MLQPAEVAGLLHDKYRRALIFWMACLMLRTRVWLYMYRCTHLQSI